MNKFVLLTHKDKRAYFEVAAANLNVMPQLVEKENQKRLKELQLVCKTKIDEMILPEHLVPRDNQVNQLKNDYRQMQQMFFEEPPSFERIIEKLRVIEDQKKA